MMNFDGVNNMRSSAQAASDSVRPQPGPSDSVRSQQTSTAIAQASAQNSVAAADVDGNSLPQSGKAIKAEPDDRQPTAQDFEAVVAKLSDFVQAVERDLSFTVDDDTGDTVIVVKDRQTDEVVRQIPSEEVLQLAQKLLELQEELEGSKGNLLEVRV